jgi:hypothetical protein
MATFHERHTQTQRQTPRRGLGDWARSHWLVLMVVLIAIAAAVILLLAYSGGGGGAGGGRGGY